MLNVREITILYPCSLRETGTGTAICAFYPHILFAIVFCQLAFKSCLHQPCEIKLAGSFQENSLT